MTREPRPETGPGCVRCDVPGGPQSRSRSEAAVRAALSSDLEHAARIFHFGTPCADVCELPCGTGPWVCGDEARKAFAEAWSGGVEGRRHLVISRFWRANVVGVFEEYWAVRPDGSATHYFEEKTDRAGSDCGDYCGWHREEVAGFVAPDGAIRELSPR